MMMMMMMMSVRNSSVDLRLTRLYISDVLKELEKLGLRQVIFYWDGHRDRFYRMWFVHVPYSVYI